MYGRLPQKFLNEASYVLSDIRIGYKDVMRDLNGMSPPNGGLSLVYGCVQQLHVHVQCHVFNYLFVTYYTYYGINSLVVCVHFVYTYM